ncbi:uncharacterized protein CANTADRAFT_26009 [Suhomyces tanzawaensis NRRL Y-17324]|uniref:Uncharacterized protein n=1 Tax=Suhomyces tanzawaensis NRRL Y-17324 TaxID=984487 RepID=A0A1E4SH84_9ASCO|nr:uncharacterized protein CANTADRAFT_26009 [Suhomyces tanzawaensis NRRL Y-17324]ODV78871.1 hypothetical protein CANTADRAFT_26009 [Suhomyces tanzawaensis NRRL Y-17324]
MVRHGKLARAGGGDCEISGSEGTSRMRIARNGAGTLKEWAKGASASESQSRYRWEPAPREKLTYSRPNINFSFPLHQFDLHTESYPMSPNPQSPANDTRVIQTDTDDQLLLLFEEKGPLYILPSLLSGLFLESLARPDEQKSVLLTLAYGETYTRALELFLLLELLVIYGLGREHPENNEVIDSFANTFGWTTAPVFATFKGENSDQRPGRRLVDMRKWFCGCDEYYTGYVVPRNSEKERSVEPTENFAANDITTGIHPSDFSQDVDEVDESRYLESEHNFGGNDHLFVSNDVVAKIQQASSIGEATPLCAHILAVLIVTYNRCIVPGVRYASTPFE